MRRFLIALFMTCVVASLQAITINWHVADSQAGSLWSDGSCVYFVYSQTELSTAQLTTPSYQGYDGYNIGFKTSASAGEYKTNVVQIGKGVGDAQINSAELSTFGNYASLTIDSMVHNGDGYVNTLQDGFFYLVVFNPDGSPNAANGTYLISGAVQYLADGRTDTDGKTNADKGIYETTVGDEVNVGDFVEVSWMGSPTTGYAPIVPEPTALALLALGVAGLALRRKI